MGGSPNSNANMAWLSILIVIQRARNEAMVASMGRCTCCGIESWQ